MNITKMLTRTLWVITLAGLFVLSGCKKGDQRHLAATEQEAEPEKGSPVQGSWKVIGYHDPKQDKRRSLPENQGRGIVIHCQDNGTYGRFEGHTKVNEIYGTYTLASPDKIAIAGFGGTKAGEPRWGSQFWKGMREAHHWEIIEQENQPSKLKLQYGEENLTILFRELPPKEDTKE